MLKIATILLVVLTTLIGYSPALTASPCPSGQTTVYKTFTISYGGTTCVVEAQICAICPLTTTNIQLGVHDIKTPHCPGIPTGKIYELVALQLVDRAQEICQIEPCTAPSTSRIFVTIPVCIADYSYRGEFGEVYHNLYSCDLTTYCEKEYTKCFDTAMGKWVTTTVGIELIGTPTCTDYGEFGLTDNDPDDETPTDCFAISCQ